VEATYQGALFDLPEREAFEGAGLEAGDYTFYFGVDLSANGGIDLDVSYGDSVSVTVTP